MNVIASVLLAKVGMKWG